MACYRDRFTFFFNGAKNILIGRCRNEGHLCGVVVRVPGYRSRVPGLIPGGTKFSEK
jgi:hypothetical protein